MRVAINALSVQGGGGLTFLRNLLQHLLALDHENEYLLLVTPARMDALGLRNHYPNLRTLLCLSRGWISRGLWKQLLLLRLLRKERADILYALGNQAPVLFEFPFVVLIQNVDPLSPTLSEYGFLLRCKTAIGRLLMGALVSRARRVIAVSEHSLKLIERGFGYLREKIAVVDHGSPEQIEVLRTTRARW